MLDRKIEYHDCSLPRGGAPLLDLLDHVLRPRRRSVLLREERRAWIGDADTILPEGTVGRVKLQVFSKYMLCGVTIPHLL